MLLMKKDKKLLFHHFLLKKLSQQVNLSIVQSLSQLEFHLILQMDIKVCNHQYLNPMNKQQIIQFLR